MNHPTPMTEANQVTRATASQSPVQDPNQQKSRIDPTSGIELRLVVTEEGNGNIEVKHQATMRGSEVIIPLRPSHLLGLLRAASAILEQKIYGNEKK